MDGAYTSFSIPDVDDDCHDIYDYGRIIGSDELSGSSVSAGWSGDLMKPLSVHEWIRQTWGVMKERRTHQIGMLRRIILMAYESESRRTDIVDIPHTFELQSPVIWSVHCMTLLFYFNNSEVTEKVNYV